MWRAALWRLLKYLDNRIRVLAEQGIRKEKAARASPDDADLEARVVVRTGTMGTTGFGVNSCG